MFLTYTFIFILGAVMGSFLSAFTYRVTRNVSVLKGRSYCPNCKKKISWYDNVPIISYILLKGRCRNCKKRISIRYPLLELSTGLLFVGMFLKALECSLLPRCLSCDFGLVCSWTNFNFIFGYVLVLILMLILVSVFIIDIEEMIIPDIIIFRGFFVFYILYAILFSEDLFNFLLSGFLAGFFILMLHLVTKGRGMGLGDVKFAILGGFILGYKMTMLWLFIAFIIGAFVGLMLIFLKKAKFGKQIPFGPFLVISFIIVIFFGPELYEFLNLPF